MKAITEQERRRGVLVELLDHWRDFFEEPGGEPALLDENALTQSSADWSPFSSMGKWPSVVETRRCVEVLERLGRGSRAEKVPVHHHHLMAYTARVEWRLVDRPCKRRDHRGRLVDDTERVRVRVVPAWVDMRVVDSALDVVLGLWTRAVALELPPGLNLGLREYVTDTGEVGWTEAA